MPAAPTDLTQGYKVQDIENIVLSVRSNGVPVLVKDVAKVSRRLYVPRLGKAGRDHEDDVVAAIVS